MARRTFLFRTIVHLFAALALLTGMPTIASSQDKPEKTNEDQKRLIKRCNPAVVKQPRFNEKAFRVCTGEKPTGYVPLVAFQIAESGAVTNIHLKQSSGFRDIDDLALNWDRSRKYDSRPGCPVIQVEASVRVDF